MTPKKAPMAPPKGESWVAWLVYMIVEHTVPCVIVILTIGVVIFVLTTFSMIVRRDDTGHLKVQQFRVTPIDVDVNVNKDKAANKEKVPTK